MSPAQRAVGHPIFAESDRACLLADRTGLTSVITYNRMVVDLADQQQLDGVFGALADATRRDIVTRVLRQESSVSGLARHYPMSFAAVQKHVAVLERACLVTKRRQGREQFVGPNIDTLRRAALVLDQFEAIWRGRMDRFGELLADTDHQQGGCPP